MKKYFSVSLAIVVLAISFQSCMTPSGVSVGGNVNIGFGTGYGNHSLGNDRFGGRGLTQPASCFFGNSNQYPVR